MTYKQKFNFLKQFEVIFFQKTKGSQLLLRSLLNAILSESLKEPIKQIKSLQSQRSYFSAEQQSSWLIEGATDADNQLTIRIQVHEHDYFQKQTSKLTITNRLDQITSKRQADRFMIHLLNFNLLQENNHYHHRYQTTTAEYTNHLGTQQIHYLELPKFTTENPETPLEKWLYFICHLNKKEQPHLLTTLIQKNPYFKLAMHLNNRPNKPLKTSILIKEDPLHMIEWQYFGEQQEKERIALKMIQSGIAYEKIIRFTDLSLAELDELALTIPMIDSWKILPRC